MSFNKSLKSGIFFTFTSQYSVIIVQIILGIFLARLLTPQEFGIIAVILIFLNLFNLLSYSIAPGIIQLKKISKLDINSFKIISILFALILSVSFVLLSFLVGKIYNENEYLILGSFLSIALFLSIINVIPSSLNRRNKKFKEIGIITFVSTCLSGIFAIILAYNSFSYYSLVAQSFLNYFLLFIGFSIVAKINIFQVDSTSVQQIFCSAKKILRYSKYNASFDFVNFFSRNIDSILIGKFIGFEELGFYDKAYRLMLYPISNLTAVLSKVLHPIFSDYQDDVEFIKIKYLKILYYILYLMLPVSVFFFTNSDLIITILYGETWTQSSELFQILALSLPIQIFNSSTGAIFLSLGFPNIYFKTGLINSFIIVSLTILGIYFNSLTILVYLLVIGYYLSSTQYYLFLFTFIFKMSFFEFVLTMKMLIFPLLISIALFYVSERVNINLIKYNEANLIFNFLVLIFSLFFSLILTGDFKKIKMLFNGK